METGSLNYKVTYRKIRNPRLEYRAGELNIVVPYGYNAELLLDKYKAWITRKKRYLQECLEISGRIELIYREEKDFRYRRTN